MMKSANALTKNMVDPIDPTYSLPTITLMKINKICQEYTTMAIEQ